MSFRRSVDGWDAASWGLIALHVVLLISWWPLLPWFVDIYYHLNVAQAFRDAGGVVLHDFWEFAPEGRPHLYPPALHLGLLWLDSLPLNVITLARLAGILAYPALFSAIWWCAREWLTPRGAYWAILCSALPFSYLLASCTTIAASWATVWWLLGMVAVQRAAWIACALCGALAFYTHLSVPWLMLLSWLVLAAAEPRLRRPLCFGAAAALLLASPWLAHLWRHRAAMELISTQENRLLELPIALYLLAAVGVAAALKQHLPARGVLFSLLAGLSPLLLHYRYRFFSGQGLLAVSLLCGVGLCAVHEAIARRVLRPLGRPGWLIPAALTAGLFAAHPVWFVEADRLVIGDTALSHLALQDERMPRSNAVSFYYPQIMDPLVEIIRRQTQPDELISCSQPSVCGLLGALSHRATTTGMLAEVRPARAPARLRAARGQASPLQSARLVVWLKGQGDAPPALEGFQPVEETDAAIVLRNPAAAGRRRMAAAAVPLTAAHALLGAAVLGIADDLLRRRRRGAIPV
ncbi:MAG: hypothetical protein HY598_00780 [Candidatus Omnitrophica bacterium]|nr:hypothetical protein [Candidatus Omnitrophota bacterium]